MVAIYWHPDAYDTSRQSLLGRHAAGEGFIRGYIRHGTSAEVALTNAVDRPAAELEELIRKIEPSDKPLRWINRGDTNGLRQAGVLNMPVPGLGQPAWLREIGDARAYSLCGVTHTTATTRAMDAICEATLAPVRPWDALVCTSRAVKAAVAVQNEALDSYLSERLGATRLPKPQYAVIPLGVTVDEFARDNTARVDWRARLAIAPEDVAALYVGRWNLTSKMNPVIMAMALERAAAKTDRSVHWIMAGWAEEHQTNAYREAVTAHTERVHVHWVDGRPPENRRSIWSAGDLFISLSENIQETFGLTPVEAMAAGLPSVVTDWDGYKDTVRHGVDGFRIAVTTPPSGLGRDIALAFGQDWIGYDPYVAAVSQFTAVDLDAAARALLELIERPSLRLQMGAAAQARAREAFDWSRVIPQYESLWAELDARRRAAPPDSPRTRNTSDNPWRPDPFRLFAGYPTEWVTSTTMLASVGLLWEDAAALMNKPLVRLVSHYLPAPDEVRLILEQLVAVPQTELGELLSRFAPARRPFLERGVVWMAKYGMLRLLGRSSHLPS